MVPHPHIEDGPFLLSVASMERLTDTLRGVSTMCFQIKSTDNEIGHPSSLDSESHLLWDAGQLSEHSSESDIVKHCCL